MRRYGFDLSSPVKSVLGSLPTLTVEREEPVAFGKAKDRQTVGARTCFGYSSASLALQFDVSYEAWARVIGLFVAVQHVSFCCHQPYAAEESRSGHWENLCSLCGRVEPRMPSDLAETLTCHYPIFWFEAREENSRLTPGFSTAKDGFLQDLETVLDCATDPLSSSIEFSQAHEVTRRFLLSVTDHWGVAREIAEHSL